MLQRFLDKYAGELLRVFVTSLAALSVDIGVLIFLKELVKFPYLLSSGLSFLAGLLTNYELSTRWAFKTRPVTNRKKEFLLFALIGIIGLILNQSILWALTQHASFYYLASKAVAVIVVFFWNYLARRYMLFSTGSN